MTLRPHSWFNIRPRRAKAMAPDIAALGAVRVVCVAGEQDELAACPRLPAGLVEAKSLKGGHKFAGGSYLPRTPAFNANERFLQELAEGKTPTAPVAGE